MYPLITVVLAALVGQSSGYHGQGCANRTVEEVYQWKAIQYAVPDDYVYDKSFLQLGAFISGVDILPNALLLMTPREAAKTPATMSTVPLYPTGSDVSPVLQPYPNLAWNTIDGNNTNCNTTLVSVQRTYRDSCNRLWALDSGVIFTLSTPQVICPPKIVIFDLNTNEAVRIIVIPKRVLTPISVLMNIRLDNEFVSKDGNSTFGQTCDDTFVYIADSPTSSLIVHRSPGDTFYKLTHPTMLPNPLNFFIKVQGEYISFFVGILGLALHGSGFNRSAFYTKPAGKPVWRAKTHYLQNGPLAILPVETALIKESESSDLLVDKTDGCLFYNPVSDGSIMVWDPDTKTRSVVIKDLEKIAILENYNQADDGSVWCTNTRVNKVIRRNVNFSEVNHRIYRIFTNPIWG